MMTRVKFLIAAAAALACAACASTVFKSSWRAPDATGLKVVAGDKIVTMVVSPNESTRRAAESLLADEMDRRGLHGLPAFNLIPTDEIRDTEKAKARIQKEGAAAVLVMRVIGKEQQINYTPPSYSGPYYSGFYGGWYGAGWGYAYSPGYLTTDTYVYVETLVFDLKQDKLIWAGQSETVNPSDAEKFINDLTKKAIEEMRKDGVLPLK